MSQPTRPLACSLAVFAALILSGCSGEPTESDMRDAFGKHPQVQLMLLAVADRKEDQVPQLLAKSRVEKIACVPAKEAPGYVCDFRWGIPDKNRIEFGPPGEGRFFKATNGWLVDLK